MALPAPLLPLLIEPIVREALREDLGRAGDITTDAIVSSDSIIEGVIAARKQMLALCGADCV